MVLAPLDIDYNSCYDRVIIEYIIVLLSITAVKPGLFKRMDIASHDSYKTKQARDLGAELHGEAIVLLGPILVTSFEHNRSSRKEMEKEHAQNEDLLRLEIFISVPYKNTMS